MNGLKSKCMRAVQPLIFGCATGITVGGVIALFLTCARVVISFAFNMYESARTPLFIVCVIILVIVCCLLTALLQTIIPTSKGSGIPLAEGCARGLLKVNWLKNAAALIAGSLLSFMSGMPLGSEGPSIGVGGLVGEGIGRIAKKPIEFRRYLITGGASAGLAAAFNAPLTGVAFALEETHRRFSPWILLAAFSAVVPAILTSQLIFWAFGQNAYLYGLGIHEGSAVLSFLAQAQYSSAALFFKVCAVAVICGSACAALATAFNYLIFGLSKLFNKIKNPVLRLLPAFLLTAACGLLYCFTIGSGERTLEEVVQHAALWLMFALLAARFALTAVASGSGATGGLFIPMIAIGGIFGTIVAYVCKLCGMDEAYAPNIIMLCISAYIAASVRAPISAIAMSVELTASFTNLLPCVIAVCVALGLAGVMRSAPLYERMTEELQRRMGVPENNINMTVHGTVLSSSVACGKRIRDILWPYNSLVTELIRDGEDIVPDGETVLLEGDNLTVRAEKVQPEEFCGQIREYISFDVNSILKRNE